MRLCYGTPEGVPFQTGWADHSRGITNQIPMNWKTSLAAVAFALAMLAFLSSSMVAAEINVNPSNLAGHLHRLQPGDVLHLAPGKYTPLYLANLNGTPQAWITVRGPESGAPAINHGSAEFQHRRDCELELPGDREPAHR